MADPKPLVLNFAELRRGDVEIVGGKNASLGEMIQALGPKGILVPPGFATTADAFRAYLTANDLDAKIGVALDALSEGRATLHKTGQTIRDLILGGEWPADTRD